MKYELIELRENVLLVAKPVAGDGRKNFGIHWSFELDLSVPHDNHIAVSVTAEINVTDPAGHPSIGQFSATHVFRVAETVDLMNDIKLEGKTGFFATLVGISLGSMRGLAYARTVNVLGTGVFMPVINPTELLKNSLPYIIQKIAQQKAKAVK